MESLRARARITERLSAFDDDERFVELFGPIVRECLREASGDIAGAARLLEERALHDRDLWVALHGETHEEPW